MFFAQHLSPCRHDLLIEFSRSCHIALSVQRFRKIEVIHSSE